MHDKSVGQSVAETANNFLFAGRMRGRVVKAPAKAEDQLTPGRATFQDAGGTLRSCSFPADKVLRQPVCHGLSMSDGSSPI